MCLLLLIYYGGKGLRTHSFGKEAVQGGKNQDGTPTNKKLKTTFSVLNRTKIGKCVCTFY
jgi:hypothetical protein